MRAPPCCTHVASEDGRKIAARFGELLTVAHRGDHAGGKRTILVSNGAKFGFRGLSSEQEVAETNGILVAGGGFVPQLLIDSVQLADSMMVRNARKCHKGKLFIQFSFSFGHFHNGGSVAPRSPT
jgi:hypothetical protein